jgi:hypothetical protein
MVASGEGPERDHPLWLRVLSPVVVFGVLIGLGALLQWTVVP